MLQIDWWAFHERGNINVKRAWASEFKSCLCHLPVERDGGRVTSSKPPFLHLENKDEDIDLEGQLQGESVWRTQNPRQMVPISGCPGLSAGGCLLLAEHEHLPQFLSPSSRTVFSLEVPGAGTVQTSLFC